MEHISVNEENFQAIHTSVENALLDGESVLRNETKSSKPFDQVVASISAATWSSFQQSRFISNVREIRV